MRAIAVTTVRQRKRSSRRAGGAVLAVAEQLVPDLAERARGGPGGPPAPRREGDRLHDGRDGDLVDRPVAGPQRRHGVGRPAGRRQRRQGLHQVEAAGEFAGAGLGRVERAEPRPATGHEHVARPHVPVRDAGVVQAAQRREQRRRARELRRPGFRVAARRGMVVTSTSVSPGISPSSRTAGLATPACCARQQARASCSTWAREPSAMCPATAGRSRASAHSWRARPDPRVSRPDR